MRFVGKEVRSIRRMMPDGSMLYSLKPVRRDQCEETPSWAGGR